MDSGSWLIVRIKRVLSPISEILKVCFVNAIHIFSAMADSFSPHTCSSNLEIQTLPSQFVELLDELPYYVCELLLESWIGLFEADPQWQCKLERPGWWPPNISYMKISVLLKSGETSDAASSQMLMMRRTSQPSAGSSRWYLIGQSLNLAALDSRCSYALQHCPTSGQAR